MKTTPLSAALCAASLCLFAEWSPVPLSITTPWGEKVTQTTDVELFVNGTKVLSMGGYNSNYQNMPINRKAFEKAVREGENEFSAHVRQTQAGQYFDCALMIDQAL